MPEFFSSFKNKIMDSFVVDEQEREEERNVEYLISLGVLLWIVAEADEEFLPEEEERIKAVLKKYGEINDGDMPIVLRTIEEANAMRVDVHAFTRDIREKLERKERLEIVEHLFRVACVDKELDEREHTMLRKIAGLLGLDHSEFIDTKIKVKKEFGLETMDN